MDTARQLAEMTVLINRAKRAGLTVHHYPEQQLVVVRVTPEKITAPEPAAEPAAPSSSSALPDSIPTQANNK
jgi:hypothetical protein